MHRYLFLWLALISAPALGAVSGQELFSGKSVSIDPGRKGTVVAFLSSKCPCSNSHIAMLKELAGQFPEFHFVAVHANADESIETSSEYFRSAALPFPVLQDTNDKLANELRALKTPHVFVLNPEGVVVYKGGATDSADANHAKKFYLRDALTDLREGRSVRVSETRTLGCVIAR